MFLKLVLKFDEKFKKILIKTKKLKKIWKKKEIKKKLENFWITKAKKRQIIIKTIKKCITSQKKKFIVFLKVIGKLSNIFKIRY